MNHLDIKVLPKQLSKLIFCNYIIIMHLNIIYFNKINFLYNIQFHLGILFHCQFHNAPFIITFLQTFKDQLNSEIWNYYVTSGPGHLLFKTFHANNYIFNPVLSSHYTSGNLYFKISNIFYQPDIKNTTKLRLTG